jgi:hypothetical protein
VLDERDRKYFLRRLGQMKTERDSFITHWKELAQYIQPRRGRFLVEDRNKGDKRYNNIINSKGTQALRVARAGMLAGTMSPARPWFSLNTINPDLMESAAVKDWLYRVELLLRQIFNSSNFYQMAPVMLGELLLFGTGCMSHVDDYENVARFYTHTAGSYVIGQNERFEINTVAREFQWTCEQIVRAFGLDKVSPTIKTAWDKGDYGNWYDVVHFCEPNPQPGNGPWASDMSHRSVYFEPGLSDGTEGKFLRESGYSEFPFYVPRWEVTGEDIYGTDCPAMTALGDVKQLQMEEKRKAQAIDKMVNPPLKGPSSLKNSPVASIPGGVTLYDMDGTKEGLSPIYQVQPQLNDLMLDIQKVEQRVDTAFYVDMFLAISNMEGIQPKNEFELSQRNQERLLQLGPVLERLHNEFADKLIDRTFRQCVRANILPPAPSELKGQELKVQYISSLAMAQKAVATGGIEHLAAFVASLAAGGFQDIHDKFDADQAVDEMANAIGVPPRLIVPDDAVAQARAERQKQMQAMQTMQMAQAAASAGKDASTAMANGSKTGGDPSLLTNIIGGNIGSPTGS